MYIDFFSTFIYVTSNNTDCVKAALQNQIVTATFSVKGSYISWLDLFCFIV